MSKSYTDYIPICKIVTAPEEFQGAVIGNINKRNGLILNTETNQGWFIAQSEVALNDMFGYCKCFHLSIFITKFLFYFIFSIFQSASEIRSLTQGKGEFAMEFLKYLPARQDVVNKLMQENAEKTQMKKKKKN